MKSLNLAAFDVFIFVIPWYTVQLYLLPCVVQGWNLKYSSPSVQVLGFATKQFYKEKQTPHQK